jgi:hypothetical protein
MSLLVVLDAMVYVLLLVLLLVVLQVLLELVLVLQVLLELVLLLVVLQALCLSCCWCLVAAELVASAMVESLVPMPIQPPEASGLQVLVSLELWSM